MLSKFISITLIAFVLNACGSGDSFAIKEKWYKPNTSVTWQWQLQGVVNTAYDVTLYDIDLFDSPQALIDTLHNNNKKVICYFSGGSYEDWRSDANQFAVADLGKALDGWQGERWLDIRSDGVRNIMKDRLDLAKQKGCDGVEPDNMDGYTNNSGFALTAAHQLDFNRFMAKEAHQRNLSIGLKNDLGQINALVDDYDFAVNEQCFEYDECDLLNPFIAQGKPVLNAEYKAIYQSDAAARKALCDQSKTLEFSTLVLSLALDDSFRYNCL